MFIRIDPFFFPFFFLNVFPIALAGNFGERQNTDCGHGNELACYQGELTPGEYVGESRGSLHHGLVPIFLISPLLLAEHSYTPVQICTQPTTQIGVLPITQSKSCGDLNLVF